MNCNNTKLAFLKLRNKNIVINIFSNDGNFIVKLKNTNINIDDVAYYLEDEISNILMILWKKDVINFKEDNEEIYLNFVNKRIIINKIA